MISLCAELTWELPFDIDFDNAYVALRTPAMGALSVTVQGTFLLRIILEGGSLGPSPLGARARRPVPGHGAGAFQYSVEVRVGAASSTYSPPAAPHLPHRF